MSDIVVKMDENKVQDEGAITIVLPGIAHPIIKEQGVINAEGNVSESQDRWASGVAHGARIAANPGYYFPRHTVS